jgi:hypothetical protein
MAWIVDSCCLFFFFFDDRAHRKESPREERPAQKPPTQSHPGQDGQTHNRTGTGTGTGERKRRGVTDDRHQARGRGGTSFFAADEPHNDLSRLGRASIHAQHHTLSGPSRLKQRVSGGGTASTAPSASSPSTCACRHALTARRARAMRPQRL